MSWTAVYPTIVAEYDEAELLSSKLTTARQMSFAEACWIVATACSGCAFVHVLVFRG
jgi:heterodisulfide reductase subunit B